MVSTFDNAIFYLDSLGLTDVILPFVLIFTVMFAILQKVGIFTEAGAEANAPRTPSKRFNAIISLAMSLLVVIPHVTRTYPVDSDPIVIINAFLPGAVVLTIVLLIFLMLIGFLGGEKSATKSPLVGIAGLLAIVGLLITLWRALYPTSSPTWLSFLDDPQLQGIIIVVLIMGIVIYAVVHEKDPTSDWKKSMREFFGGS